jgi:hypothetical protein
MSEASGRMEGHEQEGTGWFPSVTLLPAKTVKFRRVRKERR